MAKLAIYRIMNLSVDGNEEDGYEVTSTVHTNKMITIDFEDDDQILEALNKAEAFPLIKTNMMDIEIEGDWHTLYVSDAKNGRPLMILEFEEGVYE